MAQAVILAGGQGERFWPMTHAKFPKYRIQFDGKASLLQGTYRRLFKVYGKKNVHVVTTRPHFALIRAELPGLDRRNIHIEPFRNNTAAAIFLSSALMGRRHGEGESISFFPADQLIQNEVAFKETLQGALTLSQKKAILVTVGIRPTFPATGYGYIEAGAPLPGARDAYRVKRFVEKPDRRTAEKYIKNRRFFWNGGIFTWRVGVFMESMKKFAPEIYRRFDLKRLAASYKALPNTSIDYALLEKADNIAVCVTRMDWCDMGNWDMMLEKSSRDKRGNFTQGVAWHEEAGGSLLINQSAVPLVTLGAKNLIVVSTPAGTLVCPRGRAEEAALLLKKMKTRRS